MSDEDAIREAALANHHCETDGCAVQGHYTKRAGEWADKWHAMKARLVEADKLLRWVEEQGGLDPWDFSIFCERLAAYRRTGNSGVVP